MLRAVPRTMLAALASVSQFRSGNLIFAISSTCCDVIFPATILFDSFEPFSILTAFRMRMEAGGVFVMNENDLSE